MKKDIYVDADHIIYFVSMANSHKSPFDEIDGDFKDDTYKVPLKPFKKHFKELIKEYYETVEVESAFHDWKPGKMHIIFSDPKGNFRYDIFPDYKSGRDQEKGKIFYRLRKWAHKKYGYAKHVEADDIVCYHARKGAIVITTDKDVYKGSHGMFFDAHLDHRRWITTTQEEAERFTLLQTLAGDASDSIPGLPGVGITTAEKLLGDNPTWGTVVTLYQGKALHDGPPFYTKAGKESALLKRLQEANLTEEDAILTRRLVGMDQYDGKEIKLWQP